jgi:predicted transcriptional regulator
MFFDIINNVMKERHKYGYIEFTDKRKLKGDGWDDQIEPEIRKPTPAEREEIVLNLIRDHSGKSTRVGRIAAALAVSERTVQKVLRKLEESGLIRRIKRTDKNNRQRANAFEYTGPDTPRSESDLTLAKLYDPGNPCGVRDWDWDAFKFIPGYYTETFTKDDSCKCGAMLKDRKAVLARKTEAIGRRDKD